MAGASTFSKEERARVRYHLGYPSVQSNSNIGLGFVAFTQALFLVEKGLDNCLDEAVPIVRDHVQQLDNINSQLADARKRMRASALGDIKLREDEPRALRQEYGYWAKSMADVLGVPINAYSEKFSAGMGLSPISVPVNN
jgi:hypothetical protein